MNHPAASNGVSIGIFNRPKGRGIKPSSASGGLKNALTSREAKMKEAQVGDLVSVHYTGKLTNGEVFDSSRERDPLEFTLGKKELLGGFEEKVVGMKPGETKSVTLDPAEAYGNRREDLILELPKNEFPQHITPSVGLQLKMSNADGASLTVVITEVSDDSVTLDGNHPLAGQTLVFDIELIGINQ
jgi:FKBP-type peptidyl-prolyl cis-trans isomerase 2